MCCTHPYSDYPRISRQIGGLRTKKENNGRASWWKGVCFGVTFYRLPNEDASDVSGGGAPIAAGSAVPERLV